jgi:hypothetical protein
MVRADGGGTHYPYRPDVWRILHPVDARQIGSTIGTPATEKSQDLRFKLLTLHSISPLFSDMTAGKRESIDNYYNSASAPSIWA